MQKIYCLENAINFIKKGIALLLLVLLSVTAYSNLGEKNIVREAGNNFLAGRPSFIHSPNSKEEGAYSTGDCTYTLSANSQVTSKAGSGEVIVTAGESCAWEATNMANWITLISVQNGTGSGRIRYSYTKNTTLLLRTGTITIAGQNYTVTQLPTPFAPDNYEPNNTLEEAHSFTPILTENVSSISISANCHQVADIDFYKINLAVGPLYTISGVIYGRYNQIDDSNYTLFAKISYSTDGSTWNEWWSDLLSCVTISGGTFYLKIEPDIYGELGTYAAKIDVKVAATAGCTYALLSGSKSTTLEADSGQAGVTTGASCLWTATSDASWITLTSGQISTGSGNTGYAYTENMAAGTRAGTITIAGQTYTITQTGRPLVSDNYEPNNTVAEADLHSSLTPAENANTISLSANCHHANDVDIYKINLEAGYFYTISVSLYHWFNQIDNSNYTLAGKISSSTDGSIWNLLLRNKLLNVVVPVETRYLKIEPDSQPEGGAYAVKIDIKKAGIVGCTYTLPVTSKEVTWEAKTDQQAEVRTSSSGNLSCVRTATSHVPWIRLTSGQSETGTGQVVYSYDANTTRFSRTGIISIADKTYTVTQGIRPDEYEPDNTVEQATSLAATFTNHASSISISDHNCHNTSDIDIYKINLEAGYHYTISGSLYDRYNQIDDSHTISFNARIYYSTDGDTWNEWGKEQLPDKTVTGGETLYLKIDPLYWVVAYTAGIDINRTAGCTYSLSDKSKQVTPEAGLGRVTVTASSLCTSPWTATSNANWITLTSGHSGTTESGNVDYTYKPNMATGSRTGKITVAGKTYTITQDGRPLESDNYEPNNTVGEVSQIGTFTPAFTDNVSTVPISANCHHADDVDIYKINLEAGYFYTISGELYDTFNQIDNSNYTGNAKISYSTDGPAWNAWGDDHLAGKAVTGGEVLYLKIEPYNKYNQQQLGTYTAKIDINRTAGCTYNLSDKHKRATPEAGSGRVTVAASSLCTSWATTSNAAWIKITSGQSTTGSGIVDYTYKANMATESRTGTITIAAQTYTLTQEGRPLVSDDYEPNNTVGEVSQAATFTPAFTDNSSALSIAANCHINADVDIYKINLGTEHSYRISGALYDLRNQIDNSNHTLFRAKISYSSDGSTWIWWDTTEAGDLGRIVPGGTLYFKIEPYIKDDYSGNRGTYFAKIDIKIAALAACTYVLPVTNKEVTWEAKTDQQARVTSSSSGNLSCIRTADTNTSWITLTSGQSGTGSGNVGYSYTENTTMLARIGTIVIADKRYSVIQGIRPDAYEPNNTIQDAASLTATFTNNASTLSLSGANWHNSHDIDIYKINLEADYHYTITGALYRAFNQTNNSSYPIAKTSYSTDGSTWNEWGNTKLPDKTTPGGEFFYFKIEPYNYTWGENYAARIDISRTAGCTYSLLPGNKLLPLEAGTDQVTVTASSLCTSSWTATSNASWITLTSGQNGTTGSGNVGYSYTENTSRYLRSGTITAAGKTYYLAQHPRPLSPDGFEVNNTVEEAHTFTPEFIQNASSISISPANCHNVDDVDFYKINFESGDRCEVSVALYDRNTKIDNNSYTLNADIYYSTDGSEWRYMSYYSRWGLLMPEGTLYLKIQPAEKNVGSYAVQIDIKISAKAGCAYNLSATSKEATAAAGSDQIDLTTTPSCFWTATSNAAWITITSGQSTTGSGSVGYSYTENTSPDSSTRTGTITVADQTYTITQAAMQCTLSLSESSIATGIEQKNGTVQLVLTPPSCPWSAASNVTWITVSPNSGTGNSNVTYTIEENSTGAERKGTLTIGGKAIPVRQSLIAGIETTTPAVKIFPNPARDFVTIDLSSTHIKCASIKISNQLGQILYEQNNPNRKLQIPLKGLSAGLYFIFLQGEEKVMVQKLVVSNERWMRFVPSLKTRLNIQQSLETLCLTRRTGKR